MPLNKYFHGGGEKVMSSMKKQYGEKKGESVFYATANKQKAGRESAGEKRADAVGKPGSHFARLKRGKK